ncbi:nitroreductase [Amaricoccus macauensis]|uniref:nitroreductase n=1 Tax=Amaricoccus macauensis TaxID=57001 RepID=UPI003C7AD48C
MAAARRSIRAYLDRPVPRETVARILIAARAAPSGANLQPGKFHVLTGAPLDGLKAALQGAIDAGRPMVSEYSYFPKPMPPHLKARQREAGYALYAALGIDKRDLASRKRQFERNYQFFDAPVAIVITIEKGMGKGCFMDLGMAIHALLAAAAEEGLSTCGIGALANYADVVVDHLDLPEEEIVVCGIALGHADPDHPANSVRTSRMPLDEFATFSGFSDP